MEGGHQHPLQHVSTPTIVAERAPFWSEVVPGLPPPEHCFTGGCCSYFGGVGGVLTQEKVVRKKVVRVFFCIIVYA